MFQVAVGLANWSASVRPWKSPLAPVPVALSALPWPLVLGEPQVAEFPRPCCLGPWFQLDWAPTYPLNSAPVSAPCMLPGPSGLPG